MHSADELIGELNSLGLHFVIGATDTKLESPLSPSELFASLAQHPDARLRMAIIALLLYRPELAPAVPNALRRLNEVDQSTLKLFYTAAVLLQQEHAERMRALLGASTPLPDWYSDELGILPTGSPQARLKQLGERHRTLSGLAANWVGAYEHVAERLLKRLVREAAWAA